MNMELVDGALGGTSVGGTVVAWLDEDTWREVDVEAEADEADGAGRADGSSIFLNLSCNEGSSSSEELLWSSSTAFSTTGTLDLHELMSMLRYEQSQPLKYDSRWREKTL